MRIRDCRNILNRASVPARAVSLDEDPGVRADSVRLHREKVGHWSHIGNAVIFLGAASRYADRLRIDVDGLVGFLGAQGVDGDYMSTLAVVVHAPEEEKMRKIREASLGGWYNKNVSAYIEDPRSGEDLGFQRALHIVGGDDQRLLNWVLLHESGHLKFSATNTGEDNRYTPAAVKRLRNIGRGAVAAAATAEAAAIYGAAEGAPPALMIPVIAAGGLALLAGGVAAKFPLQLLWVASGEERRADRFAYTHRQSQQFVIFEPEPTPLPQDHLIVPHENFQYAHTYLDVMTVLTPGPERIEL
jgi:hypothetical protein